MNVIMIMWSSPSIFEWYKLMASLSFNMDTLKDMCHNEIETYAHIVDIIPSSFC